MKNIHFLKSSVFSLVLALTAYGIWSFEIHQIIGWQSVKWLYRPLISPWLIALIAAIAAISPFLIYKKVQINSKTILAAVILFGVGILSYYFAEMGFKMWFGGLYILVSVVALSGLVFYLTTHFLIKKIKAIYILGVWAAIIGSYFFSIALSPNWVDAIKLGYPFFFIVLNVGVVSTFVAQWATVKETDKAFEEVLDMPLGI